MSGQPPKKGLSGGVIAAIAGVVGLVLLICCVGGFFLYQNNQDDDGDATSTSETSEEPTDEDPTDEDPTEDPTDEDPTDEPTTDEGPTEDPTTDEPTDDTDTSTDAPTGGGTSVDFPSSYDGWVNNTPSSTTLASYAKGSDRFSVIASNYLRPSNYEQLWDDVNTYGDVSCGQRASQGDSVYCTAEKNESTFLATSSNLSEDELADALQGMLDEL